MTLKRFAGDSFPPIEAEIKLNNAAFDLSDAASVTFNWFDGSEVHTLTGTITNAPAGLVEFDVQETFFTKPGRFRYDIEVTLNNGKKGTFKRDMLEIVGEINYSKSI